VGGGGDGHRGKSGHLRRIAGGYVSTTPARLLYFLHPAEGFMATGACWPGGDLVIALSSAGEDGEDSAFAANAKEDGRWLESVFAAR